jgi:hypothetical protein
MTLSPSSDMAAQGFALSYILMKDGVDRHVQIARCPRKVMPIMTQEPSEERSDLALLAIQRVLEEERSSEAALQACRQRAQAVVAARRDKAQAIAQQANASDGRVRRRGVIFRMA